MDSILTGAILIIVGAIVGGGGVWAIVRHYENERMALHQIIGQMQREAMHQSIPEEEL